MTTTVRVETSDRPALIVTTDGERIVVATDSWVETFVHDTRNLQIFELPEHTREILDSFPEPEEDRPSTHPLITPEDFAQG